MVKRMIRTVTAGCIAAAMILSTVCSYGEVKITPERTTVTNMLPDVTVYMDTDRDYESGVEDTKVAVDETDAEVVSVETFGESGEGMTYYILIDLSTSQTQEDFDMIKKNVTAFSDDLGEKDVIRLVPFGDSVYTDEGRYTAGDEEFAAAVNSLELKDNNTVLYSAIDNVVALSEEESEDGVLRRSVAMVFTDGMDDTTGGQITGEEASAKMKERGIPLYAFVPGDNKEGKDALASFCREINGSFTAVDASTLGSELKSFSEVMDGTLVVKAKVGNSSDIVNEFDIRVQLGSDGLEVKKTAVSANKDEDSKDSTSVAVKKLITKYWWVIAVLLIAIIVGAALLIIRRNKGIVTVDGKVVYGGKVQKKYHMQVKEKNTREINFETSVNGGPAEAQKVTLVESVIVGRSSMCDIYYDDKKMSRQHFCIQLFGDDLYLEDLESMSGTYLNGVKVASKQKLSRGDRITAGVTTIRIEW